MKVSRWLPGAVGLTLLAVLLAVGFWPARATVAGTGGASLPDRFATYSYLTGDVSTAPPGRAVAIWLHGFGVEFMDFPQAGLLGADGDIYRRVDAAEDRAGAESQGDPAPMLLSPDGTTIAIGGYSLGEADLLLVDLATGEDTPYPVVGGSTVLPLAWSPDSAQVVYLTTPGPTDPYSGGALSGQLGMLDVSTGTARILPDQGDGEARAAAFSADGTQLAVHRIEPDDGTLSGLDGSPRLGGGVIDVVDLDGRLVRQVPVPEHHYLDGPHSWSPDGALLATGMEYSPPCDHLPTMEDAWIECYNAYEGPTEGVVFLDASGRDGAVPPPLPVDVTGGSSVLGWTPQGEVLLQVPQEPSDVNSDLHWITALSVSGEARRISAVPVGPSYGVGGLQLATALLPDLQVREAGAPDRGPWPPVLGVAVALGAAGVAFLLTWVLTQVLGRIRRARAG
jgi:hypothetical protein